MKILFFGDVVGRPGREAVGKLLPELKVEHNPDLVIANVENLAHGKGVTIHTLSSFMETGVDFFTSGNHVFDKPEAKQVFEKYSDKIIRPANFSPFGGSPEGRPDNLPGKGYTIITVKEQPVLMINLNGEVFMEKQFDYGAISNPFQAINQILASEGDKTKIRILDFHAEATSEKRAMGFWVDGRISALVGTHTHIQSNDAQILQNGTGYVTDLGMVGAADSVIGVNREGVMKRFLVTPGSPEAMPLDVAETGKYEVGYALLEIDEQTGKCLNIISKLEIVQ